MGIAKGRPAGRVLLALRSAEVIMPRPESKFRLPSLGLDSSILPPPRANTHPVQLACVSLSMCSPWSGGGIHQVDSRRTDNVRRLEEPIKKVVSWPPRVNHGVDEIRRRRGGRAGGKLNGPYRPRRAWIGMKGVYMWHYLHGTTSAARAACTASCRIVGRGKVTYPSCRACLPSGFGRVH